MITGTCSPSGSTSGKRPAVAPAGGQHDFQPGPFGPQHGLPRRLGQLVLAVDQRAVDVQGEEAIVGHRGNHSSVSDGQGDDAAWA